MVKMMFEAGWVQPSNAKSGPMAPTPALHRSTLNFFRPHQRQLETSKQQRRHEPFRSAQQPWPRNASPTKTPVCKAIFSRPSPFSLEPTGNTMAATEADPLLLLRQSIASGGAIIPTTTADTSGNAPEVTLSNATHLHFTLPARVAIPIDAPTRFESNGSPVDLRSIYFAWLNREVAIPEYNDSATKLNDELAGSSTVHKFAFVERLDLITWLEGASEESEYIKALTGDKEGGQASGSATTTATSKTTLASSSARAGRGTLDPRLAQIYGGERRMGDRNTVLRGVKPTVCSRLPRTLPSF